MVRMVVETEAAPALPLAGEGRDLLALLAFGMAEPLGSQHPLTQAVRRLRRVHRIDVAPLLTYYDRAVEDAEDAANLEAAWQDAASLRGCVQAVRAAIAADPTLPPLLADYPALAASLADLEMRAADAVKAGVRIRLSFLLD